MDVSDENSLTTFGNFSRDVAQLQKPESREKDFTASQSGEKLPVWTDFTKKFA